MKKLIQLMVLVLAVICTPKSARSTDLQELEDRLKAKEDKVSEENSSTIKMIGKIVARKQLSRKEKAQFVSLAEKYELPQLPRIQAIIRKKGWGKQERKFLFAQLRKMIWRQKALMVVHREDRLWLNTKVRADSDFSNKAVKRWCKNNVQWIEYHKGTIAKLTNYETALRGVRF